MAVRFPDPASPRWFVSGFEDGAEELGGTAAVVDEPYADGRVVAFAGEPNFRAFTDGTQKILWNAIYGADPTGRTVPLSATAEQRRQAAAAARSLRTYDGRVVLTLRAASVGDASRPRSSGPVSTRSSNAPTARPATRFLAPDGDGRELVRRLGPALRRVDGPAGRVPGSRRAVNMQ